MLEVKRPADTEDYLPLEVQLLQWNSADYLLFILFSVFWFSNLNNINNISDIS